MFFWGALRLVNIGPISHNCLAIYNNNIRTVRLLGLDALERPGEQS